MGTLGPMPLMPDKNSRKHPSKGLLESRVNPPNLYSWLESPPSWENFQFISLIKSMCPTIFPWRLLSRASRVTQHNESNP